MQVRLALTNSVVTTPSHSSLMVLERKASWPCALWAHRQPTTLEGSARSSCADMGFAGPWAGILVQPRVLRFAPLSPNLAHKHTHSSVLYSPPTSRSDADTVPLCESHVERGDCTHTVATCENIPRGAPNEDAPTCSCEPESTRDSDLWSYPHQILLGTVRGEVMHSSLRTGQCRDSVHGEPAATRGCRQSGCSPACAGRCRTCSLSTQFLHVPQSSRSHPSPAAAHRSWPLHATALLLRRGSGRRGRASAASPRAKGSPPRPPPPAALRRRCRGPQTSRATRPRSRRLEEPGRGASSTGGAELKFWLAEALEAAGVSAENGGMGTDRE